jgi:myo-inositol-1(or 4)-monophosphatase
MALKVLHKPEFDLLLAFAHQLADLSASVILPQFRQPTPVENKARDRRFDPVTDADRRAERAIRDAIAKRFPDHDVVGEEYGPITGGGRFQWVIDPVDGTRAFITGSPLWGTLIGLLADGVPVLGVMDQPFTRERFWSSAEQAHWRGVDGMPRRLRARACPHLKEAVLTTTDPDLFSSASEKAGFERVKSRARMTRYGGDCYAYCLLAAGFIDVIVEAGLKPHDVVALVPIIERAGGVITTWSGEPALAGGQIVAAGDARVHSEALALLSPQGAD